MQECMVALRTKVSDFDSSRASMKKGYRQTSVSLLEKLSTLIDEVADVDERKRANIQAVIKKASLLWLEFSKQRFRIVLLVTSGPISMEDKIREAKNGNLEIVLKPRLITFGDSRGMELEEQGTIEGCDGEVLKIQR